VKKRKTEFGAATQPHAGPVARISGDLVNLVKQMRQTHRAELVAQGKWSGGIAKAQPDRSVDIGGRSNALLGNFTANRNNHRENSRRDKTRAIANDRNANTISGKQRVRCIAVVRAGGWRGHEGSALTRAPCDSKKRIDCDGTLGWPVETGVRGVMAKRREENQ
jgi:hypothetical protein